jgi:hypothetical protein
VIGGVAKETNDLLDAPVSVAKGAEHGQHHESERDEVGVGAARHGQSHEKAEQAQNRLLRPGERQDREEAENDCCEDKKERTRRIW